MGVFKTIITGYGIMFKNFNMKYGTKLPKIFAGTGTGLMMVGSALIARDSCKGEVQQAIRDAEATLNEDLKPVEGENKAKKVRRYLKAHAVHGWKMVKIYKKGVICNVVGAVSNGVGIGLSENGRKKALAGAAAVGAEFAAYRAAVRSDLGDEADIRYMNGKKTKHLKVTKTKEGLKVADQSEEDDGVTIKKDPSAFRFWFSKETCPSIWSPNYDLRLHNLDHVTDMLNHQYIMTWTNGGALTLNDQRREFGGLNPRSMDVDIGGIFGRVYDKDRPESKRLINLHYRDDQDFMEGRTEGCWIIFDVDPEPIIGRTKRKFTQVEEA